MTIEPPARPDFSIVTPSRNMLRYLRRCAASVADQGVATEHLVLDACSDDGTGAWLAEQGGVEAVVEPDRGMYDALNKGFARARGRIFGWLNCDEQYLPGALPRVRAHFDRHPETDIVCGGCLLVAPDGAMLAYRKAYAPRWPLIATSHLYVLSCAMFFRRRIWERGLRFDDRLRDIADAKLVVDALRDGARADVLGGYLAAFTMTGHNMSAGDNAARERSAWAAELGPVLRALRLPLNGLRLLDKARHGAYHQRFPLTYALYTEDSPAVRRAFTVRSGSPFWRAPAGEGTR